MTVKTTTNERSETTDERHLDRGTRSGKLKAKPIMIYPANAEERRLIVEAAARVGGRRISVSAFVMDSMVKVSKQILSSETMVESPLSSLTLPQNSAETPEARAFRLTERLRGLLKDDLAAHGGAEGFLRWLRSDEDEVA